MSCLASQMTMRAEVLRNVAGTDSYGHVKKSKGNLSIIQDGMPCYVFISTEKGLIDGKEFVLETIEGFFHHNADILIGDQIAQVKDRRGRVIIAGTLVIDSIAEKTEGARPSHKKVILRRVRG